MNRWAKARRLTAIFTHYKTGQTVLPYPPLRMWVETTNRCNLRCSVCPNATDTVSERGEMDMEVFGTVLEQIRGKVNDINLSHRGEPLFHPHLEDMIRLAGKANVGTRIHTNATLLDAGRAESLLQATPDLISFSFDGYDRKTYESVRRGGSFEQTYANIRRFLKMKRERKQTRPYTIIQIIQPSGADAQYLENLRIFGDGMLAAGLDKFYVKQPHNWAGNAPGETTAAPGYLPCTFLYYSLTVLWNGDVCPCPQDWYCSLCLGNVKDEPIDRIWNGPGMIDLRRRLQRRELDGLLCMRCDRVFRKNISGVPTENLKAFFGETLAGYEWVRKLIRK